MANLDEVASLIKAVIPDAQVSIEDLNGGGDHLQVNVTSSLFIGLSKIKQHQMVYSALQKELENESIHALALNTFIPN